MRQQAENWLEVADRVYHFRRDLLTAAQTQQLVAATGEVRLLLKQKAETEKLKLGIDRLEGALRETGGRYYPQSSVVENVEFFLVAALVILGLRAYFVQPFKIPTNSMWPSYYGMTAEVHPAGEAPGWAAKLARLAAFGAWNHSLTAPADGEISIAVDVVGGDVAPASITTAGRSMLIFPALKREFLFRVGSAEARVKVPAEFVFGNVLAERFGLTQATLRRAALNHRPLDTSIITEFRDGRPVERRIAWVPLGQHARRGEVFLSFDVMSGDLLFVDRISYHFVRPKVGQGFVFRTENIRHPDMESPPGSGNQIRQYYIKRLVGAPGDRLSVQPPVLLRNGKPVEGAKAFSSQHSRRDGFSGYTIGKTGGFLDSATDYVVPAAHFFAMGDNSNNSADSRFWGPIPEKDAVGKPLFIYYPFTRRWGPAN
jgi:signal peptidase I